MFQNYFAQNIMLHKYIYHKNYKEEKKKYFNKPFNSYFYKTKELQDKNIPKNFLKN